MTEQQQEEKRYDPNDTTLKFVTRQDDISIYIFYCCFYIFVFFCFFFNLCERRRKQVHFYMESVTENLFFLWFYIYTASVKDDSYIAQRNEIYCTVLERSSIV